MGIFNWTRRARASPPEKRTNQKLDDFIKGVDLEGVGATSSGVSVDEDSALKISAVYACVKVISETVASLPLKLMKEDTNGDVNKATHHPLFTLLADCPNNEMTAFTFREMMMTNLLLWGNAYALVKRNKEGKVVELYPLKSQNMTVIRDPTTDAIKYQYTSERTTQTKIYKSRQVLHIPAFSFDGVIGVSPIEYAREAMGLATSSAATSSVHSSTR